MKCALFSQIVSLCVLAAPLNPIERTCLSPLATITKIARQEKTRRRIVRQDQELLENAYSSAYEQAPLAPLSRAKLLRTQLLEADDMLGTLHFFTFQPPAPRFSAYVPLVEDRAHREGQFFPRIRYWASPGNTVFFGNGHFEGNRWVLPSKAEATFVVLPGTAAHSSNISSWFRFMDFVEKLNTAKANPNSTDPASLLKDRLKKAKRFHHLGVIGFDTPGQGLGPDPKLFSTRRSYTAWLAQEISRIREWLPENHPLILFVASSNSIVIPHLLKEYPDLVDALAMAAPVHLEDYAYSLQDHIDGAYSRNYYENSIALSFTNKMAATSNWHWTPGLEYLQIPIWVIVGEHDAETSQRARQLWKEDLESLAHRGGYLEIEGAYHNPFSILRERRESGLNSFFALEEFAHFVLTP